MAAESPVSILYGNNGSSYIETSIRAGIAVPSGQPGFIALGSDGTNTRYLRTASDGTVRVDPTGTTVQPVSQSGTWTVQPGNTANTTPWLTSIAAGGNTAVVTASNALKVDGSAVTQPISAAALPLPSGAATETTLASLLTLAGFQARINTLGQKTMANSTPVVLASDQTVIPVSDNAGSLTVDSPQLPSALVSGRLDVNVGASTTIAVSQSGTWTVAQGTAAALSGYWPVRITDGTNTRPTADVASRADFSKITDGTNTMPTGDAVARSIFHQVSDGTTGPVAVKAASTAPAVADKALVVVISPNQQAIPTTTAAASAVTGQAFGRFTNGSAGVTRAVRETAYTEQTANFTGSVKSSSTSDTSAGTGARTVRITYFDQTGAGPYTEDVTLNGTTAVNLVQTNHCFIEKIEVLTVGSTGSNAGTITLYTGSGGTGTTVGSIAFATVSAGVGDNQTFWAHHYVPSGKTASVYQVGGGTTGNQIAIMFLRAVDPTSSANAERQISDFLTIPNGGPFSNRTQANPVHVTGFARITAYINSNGSNTDYFVSFDYSEV